MCGKQGGKLEGNASRKLLKSTFSLEDHLKCQSKDMYERGLPYILTLRDFNEVVHCCFGNELLEGWQESISRFTYSYKQLRNNKGCPVSITPKVKFSLLYKLFP